MNTILFDDKQHSQLYPLTLTRPSAELRCGILTLAEKWAHHLNCKVSYLTLDYLSTKFPISLKEDNYFINGRCLPDQNIVTQIVNLSINQAIYQNDTLIAFRGSSFDAVSSADKMDAASSCILLDKVHNLFIFNHQEINNDFILLTKGRTSEAISKTNTILGSHPIFIESGAKVEASVLNVSEGPIYIGKDAEIMEGSLVRGPFALCEHATLKMGAKIYNGTTIGPHCKVGGEVSNSILLGFSNKGHDGFLGNSVLGEWCNIGADSNTSNLKNNYEIVKLWNYDSERFEKTGTQFCGLFMGDHSKCGINTMFNTGTVVGVSANIFGSGFPRNFIPSFSWGGAQGFDTYASTKAYQTAELVMKRRGISLTEEDKKIFNHIYTLESKYRTWEKL
jgi:UDP-N-acetylglucosamine diphosphorylase/glucosamine-1-phosphate N-acetyltransferase